jgi:hypothetical protein
VYNSVLRSLVCFSPYGNKSFQSSFFFNKPGIEHHKTKEKNKVDIFYGTLQQEACLLSITISEKNRKERELTSPVRKQPRP